MICTELKRAALADFQILKRDPVFGIKFETLRDEDDNDPEDDRHYGWIDLGDFEYNAARLQGPQEIVLRSHEVIIIIDYPVKNPAQATLAAPNARSFRCIDLARGVHEAYGQLYAQEAETSTIPVIPVEQREVSLNRNATDGLYGIWGHDLEDLAIHKVSVYQIDERYVLTLDMYS